MYIIGISAYYHDSAACIIFNDKILSAVQEERFTRKKHDSNFPINSIKFCLESNNLSADQIDYVVDGIEVFHREYHYRCGVTKEVVEHHQTQSKASVKLLDIKKGSFIVDVGSNDGTFTNFFEALI